MKNTSDNIIGNPHIMHVIPSSQQLLLYHGHTHLKTFLIATSRYGLGETIGSYKTPRGWHIIRAKIGAGCAVNTVFVARRPTGEIYTTELAALYPTRDWILTRVLWLQGCVKGKNRLGDVDTMRRYIYIHGTPDDVTLGNQPSSHGCIRMRNRDLLELYDIVNVGDKVFIGEILEEIFSV